MTNLGKRKIILASSSPRRKMLLKSIIDKFEIVVPNVEEINDGKPCDIAKGNAKIKGEAIIDNENIIIACDTLVAMNEEIYGKPDNFENAMVMLNKLQGKSHSVFSGVYVRQGSKEVNFVEESKVFIKELNKKDIENYLNEYKPYDKAGAYGIQDGVIVKGYSGSYSNIVGLPIEKLQIVLRENFGVTNG